MEPRTDLITNEDYDTIFERLLEKVKGDALQFIESLHSYYERNGGLTPKQHAAVMKFYERTSNKKR